MGENKYSIGGCLPAKKDLRDYKICSANIEQDYPLEFQLENLPRVKNQLTINSCCAHATSSILEYYTKNSKQLSTNFIYGIQHKEYQQNQMGMYLAQACGIVQKYGDMLESDCAGNTEIPTCWIQAEKSLTNQYAVDEAYKFRILNYYLCSSDNDIKYALMHYGPVLGAIDWREDCYLDINSVVHFNRQSKSGGHAIMIYGWNEYGWLIQNSWGTEFGKNGRFILPYDYGFLEARALIDYDNPEDLALCKPKNNKIYNILYKIGNWFINLSQRGLY